MNRNEFHLKFGNDRSIVCPVIHVLDHEQTKRNILISIECGCPGVFLINHDFEKGCNCKIISITCSLIIHIILISS